MNKRPQCGNQFLRHSLRLFVHSRANVKGFGFEDDRVGLIENTVSKVQADAPDGVTRISIVSKSS
jgi:hypothetical protein